VKFQSVFFVSDANIFKQDSEFEVCFFLQGSEVIPTTRMFIMFALEEEFLKTECYLCLIE